MWQVQAGSREKPLVQESGNEALQTGSDYIEPPDSHQYLRFAHIFKIHLFGQGGRQVQTKGAAPCQGSI